MASASRSPAVFVLGSRRTLERDVTDFGQAILDGLKNLETRLDRMDERLDRMGERLDRMDARLGRIENRLDHAEVRLDALEKSVAHLRAEIEHLPDFSLMMARSAITLERLNGVRDDMRETKIRLDEVFQSMATAPEITSLREEVRQFRAAEIDREIRIRALEERAPT